MRLAICVLCAFAASATTYTVKNGGGGDYTTIQACATAMSNGDTCTVYAGTYNEHVDVPAGGVGAYKTLQVNGTDLVYVYDFSVNSHTKIVGFHIQNPASPNSSDCILIPSAATDIVVAQNDIQQCGAHAAIHVDNAGVASFIYVQGNTVSYSCSTPASPNVCGAFSLHGDHMLVENNNVSHVSDVCNNCSVSQFVFRKNVLHDFTTDDCGVNSGNCHIDLSESEPNIARTDILAESNVGNNNVGLNGHAFLMQGDACAGQCERYIVRLNALAHFGSIGVLDDNAGNSSVNPGFTHVKVYNNSFVDFNAYSANQPYGVTNVHANHSTYGAELNNLFYYPEDLIDFNPYMVDALSATGAQYGNNLAWCTGGTCNLRSHTYNSGAFTDDTGNLQADPLFVSYASSDFHLTSTSPARGAGTYLTLVAGGDSGSGTSLVVADASFFQDGYGLTGVGADWIRVGTSVTVQVSSINYATNTITLANGITRSASDPVYLYKDSSGAVVLNGAVPDIGAYQFVSPATSSQWTGSFRGKLNTPAVPTVPGIVSGNVLTCGGSSPITCALPNSVVAGNKIWVGTVEPGDPATTITDTQGNTYTLVYDDTGRGNRQYIATAASSGPVTITFTRSGSNGIVAAEYGGITLAGGIDGSSPDGGGTTVATQQRVANGTALDVNHIGDIVICSVRDYDATSVTPTDGVWSTGDALHFRAGFHELTALFDTVTTVTTTGATGYYVGAGTISAGGCTVWRAL